MLTKHSTINENIDVLWNSTAYEFLVDYNLIKIKDTYIHEFLMKKYNCRP